MALAASVHAHSAFYDEDLVEADRLASRAVDVLEENNLQDIIPTVQVYPIVDQR